MNALKEFIDDVRKLFISLDNSEVKLVKELHNRGMRAEAIFHKEIIAYVMYLAYSDERISKNEKDFISKYMDLNMTYDEIKNYIKTCGIDFDEYGYKVPVSVELMVCADNELVKEKSELFGSKIIYDFYKRVGQALLACDENVDTDEIFALNIFLQTIQKYINSNCRYGAVIVSNPAMDAKEAFKLIGTVNKFDRSAVEKVIRDTTAKRKEEEAEFDRMLKSVPNPQPAPWDTQYLNHPCPYCGAYKVRYAKWDDKAFSTAFWGAFSYELHCHYKCDACKKMWE